MKKITFSNR